MPLKKLSFVWWTLLKELSSVLASPPPSTCNTKTLTTKERLSIIKTEDRLWEGESERKTVSVFMNRWSGIFPPSQILLCIDFPFISFYLLAFHFDSLGTFTITKSSKCSNIYLWPLFVMCDWLHILFKLENPIIISHNFLYCCTALMYFPVF